MSNPTHSITLETQGAKALIWRLLREDGRKHAWGYALAFFFMALVAAATGASAWMMEDIINKVIVEGDQNAVRWIAAAVASIFIVKGAAAYGQQIVLARIGNAIVASIQSRIYDHVLAQDLGFFHRVGSSDLVTRMSHNAAAARNALNLVVTSIGRDALTLVALIIVMIVKDPMMSLFAVLIGPPAVIGIAMLVRRMRKAAKAEFEFITQVVGAMQETAQGARVIKAFTLEDQMRARMGGAIANVESRSNRIAALGARSSPLMETLGGLAIAGVILYAGWAVSAESQTPGAVVAFLTAMLLAYDPAKRLAKLSVQLRQSLVGVGLLYDLLDAPSGMTESLDAVALRVTEGRVTLDDVTFQYADVPVLHGTTMEASAGKVTALVGPSGAGKSTVLNLLERFYDPQSGTVRIDGQDLRGVTFSSLRAQIALVSQDTFLFEGTIRDNIALGKQGATDAQIEQAARDANAHDFILEQPDGYATQVGSGGGALSGGQRQRIAIARAMLRDAPILLLDEATSALDAQAEAHVQDALNRLMQGRTVIVIAHRLSTVRNADTIHVFESGRIVQSGTHDALLSGGGLYATLYALQFSERAA